MEFIENAPHSTDGVDIISELNKAGAKFQFFYWLVVIIVISLVGILVNLKYVWIIGIAAGILSTPIVKAVQKRKYDKLLINSTLIK